MKKNEYIKVYQWMNTLRGGVLRDVYALLYQLGQKGDVKVMVCDNENEVYELSEDMIEKCLGCVCIYGI